MFQCSMHAVVGILDNSCHREKGRVKGELDDRIVVGMPQYSSSLNGRASCSDIIASTAAVVGSTRGVASVVATTAGTSLSVTSAVVLLLNGDGIALTVVSVNQKSKKLERCQ